MNPATVLGEATWARQSAAKTLADFCVNLAWEDVDVAARARTQELFLDHLGVALAGSQSPSSVAIRTYIGTLSSKTGVTVYGSAVRAQAPWAALANGAAAHALELDDCVRESSLHPGATVIPAALAAAEAVGASPIRLLESIVGGYETTIRIGAALNPDSAYRRGFHPTGIAGVFGAAVAAGKAYGLSAPQMTNALAIAGNMASGSLEYLTDGSWTKRLTPGWAAHAGVVAAGLAQSDYLGPESALDGPLGFLHAYSDAPEPSLLLEGLGVKPLGVTQVSIKPYACCRYVHGIIDCMLAIRASDHPNPNDIDRIDLGILSIGRLLVAEPIDRKQHPRTVVDAQFSAPFAAAVALLVGRAGRGEYSTAILDDPRMRSLMERVYCYEDSELEAAYPARFAARVSLRLSNGQTIRAGVDNALGEPQNPLSRTQLVARFVDLAGGLIGFGRAQQVAERLLGLEREIDLTVVATLLSRGDHGNARAPSSETTTQKPP